jgi:RHS repeat-associated protein
VLSNEATGERYRWVGENESARTRNLDDGYTTQNSRYNGRGVTLYGNGEAVAVSYSSSGGSRSMYMGKDIMGSVRSVTVDTGMLEDRYEYDAFGQPYKGDLTGGMNLGYSGKPYDTATGLYNYGYRDYKPQAARFTTVDPIRDGNNWYAYVNNDPVNWVDLWGLDMMYSTYIQGTDKITSTYVPTNPNGSIDYANIKTYNFNATNDVTTNPNKTMPQSGTPEYYYPQSFPTGTWDLEPSRVVASDDPKKEYKGDVYVPTNASQIVNTYGYTVPTSSSQPTGKQVDTGYGLHASSSSVTAGCIKFGSQEEANKFATLSDQALASNNGKSTLTVQDKEKKSK